MSPKASERATFTSTAKGSVVAPGPSTPLPPHSFLVKNPKGAIKAVISPQVIALSDKTYNQIVAAYKAAHKPLPLSSDPTVFAAVGYAMPEPPGWTP